MIRTLILCLVLVNAALAQKVLHVSTIPAKADIYVQKIRPDHTQNPDYVSPAFIPVSEEQEAEGEIIVSLFHPDFADTTVRVRLSDRDTSYLIMSQRGVLDESLLERQRSEISKRSRKNFGRGLIYTSVLPFAASAIAGIVSYYETSKANNRKETLDKAAIAECKHYRDVESELEDYRNTAKASRTAAYAGLAVGASLLTIGFILSF